MNKQDLITKWLDNNLNSEEQKAFEALEDYKEFIHLSEATAQFQPPIYDVDSEYAVVKSRLQNSEKNYQSWLKPLLRVAAVVLIGLSIFYYTANLDTNIVTAIAQQTSVELPDASFVELNAASKLSFNKKKWSSKREVLLEGEAYFKVAKGSVFDVKTNTGTVTVLGTQFNVTQRDGFFKVVCYEGLVEATYKDNSQQLHPGESIIIIDGKIIATEKEKITQPQWINGESAFKSIPLKHVLSEFERQYDVILKLDAINTESLYTGSFTHNNLDLALKSITLPLHLSYIKSGDTIIISGE